MCTVSYAHNTHVHRHTHTCMHAHPRIYVQIIIKHIMANKPTYTLLQHFPVSLCNAPLVVYANVKHDQLIPNNYAHTFLAFRSSRVSIFTGGGVSTGSCVHQRIKPNASVYAQYVLQTHEETRTLPCTAKVSSREVICPMEADRELAL